MQGGEAIVEKSTVCERITLFDACGIWIAQVELLVYESPRGGEPQVVSMHLGASGVWSAKVS